MTSYIQDYYRAITTGEITAGKWVHLVYWYIVQGLEDKRFYYDAKKADKAVRFIETFCHHSKGRDDLIVLELWEKALICVIFGIVDIWGKRQFFEVVIVIGKKNGKSLLASAIVAYVFYCDGEYGAEIYCAAPKLDQAEFVYSCFWQTVKHEPSLMQRTKSRKGDIYVAKTNSFVKKLPFNEKKSEGINPHMVICDEIASWPGAKGMKQYETFASAGAGRSQPILLSITTSGYEHEGIYDELINRCTRMLMGDSREARLVAFLYMIDDTSKWDDLEELKKSNPNLGVSVSVEFLKNAIEIAKTNLSKKAEFLTKHCNIKQNSSQAWLPAQAVGKNFGEALSLEDFRDCYCVGGIDLSRTTDLTACCIVIEKDRKLYTFTQFFMPAETLQDAVSRDNLPYDAYVKRGIIKLSGENFVQYQDCFDWFASLVRDYQIYPLKVGYDRYSSQYLVQQMAEANFHMDDVYQGYNLSPVIQETEGLMKDGAFDFGDNDLMKIHLLDTAVKTDAESGKRKAVKLKTTVHIDGCAALLDAMTVRQKYYSEIGEQLKNED